MKSSISIFGRLAITCVSLAAASAFAVPFRIMPLGDSITEGAGWDGGGYRAVLREKLDD